MAQFKYVTVIDPNNGLPVVYSENPASGTGIPTDQIVVEENNLICRVLLSNPDSWRSYFNCMFVVYTVTE